MVPSTTNWGQSDKSSKNVVSGANDLGLDRRETNSFTLLMKLVLQQKTKLVREEHCVQIVGKCC